jgi:MFS family permease
MTKSAIPAPRLEVQSGWAAVLRCPSFVVLWLSEGLSFIGDRLIMVALVTLVYERTHSTGAVGLLMMLKAIPALVLGSVAGVCVDRKWIMVGSNLIQGVLVFLIPATGALPVVFIVYTAMAVVNQFFVPARSATIPDLVPPAALLAANSLFAISMVGAIAIGPAIGGWITEQFGLDAAFYADAATFLVPAVAVGLLAIPRARTSAAGRGLGADLREGLSFARRHAEVLTALTLIAAAALIIGTMSVLGVVIARETLRAGAGAFGMLMSTMGGGMLVGAIGASRLGQRFDRVRLGALGACLMAVAIIALPWAPHLYLALGCAALIGFGMMTIQVNCFTVLQTASESLRGRLTGMAQALMGSATLVTTALAGLLAECVGTEVVLACAGGLTLVAGSTVLLAQVRKRK